MADRSGRWNVWHSRQGLGATRTVGWYYGDRTSHGAVGPFQSVSLAKKEAAAAAEKAALEARATEEAAAAAAAAGLAMASEVVVESDEEGESEGEAVTTAEEEVEEEEVGGRVVTTRSSEVGSSSSSSSSSAEESDVQDESQVDLVPSAIVRGCPREVVLQAMGLETDYFLQVLEQGYFTPNR